MKLTKVSIFGFKSIKETLNIVIDEKSTILIGANDNGKTNILQAITKLNGNSFIKEDEVNWDLPDGKTAAIDWYFRLDEQDKEELSKFVSDESDLSGQGDAETGDDSAQKEYLGFDDIDCIVYRRDGVGKKLVVKSVPYRILAGHMEAILKLRPIVEFFTPVTTNLKDEITLAELENDDFEFMQGIFQLADLWEVRKELFVQNSQTSKMLDDASSRLTKVLNDKWNQGKDLEWRFVHSGNNGDKIVIEIKDPSVKSRFSRPSLRSSGFQTYFVLSMIINARKYKNLNNSYIFLFDEPGTYLHPFAQLDLQRSFEAVAADQQIIYTTHSLFLINKNYPKRNRVISKTKNGTQVDLKPFQKNWKSVRESLGILLSNNFLIAEKSLLVEGPSDVIYFLDVVRRLKNTGDIDIDLNDFSVVDAGSADNYIAMAKLMLSEGRDVVAMVDGDVSGKRTREKLEKLCPKEVQKKQLRFHTLPDNKSIEDICCNLDILRVSIRELSEDLSVAGDRQLMESVDVANDLKKIKPVASKTLGYTINEITRVWYKPQEPLSKLSIALKYEDNVQNKEIQVSPDAKELVSRIKDLMNLKGEKSAEKGVFDEV